VSIRVDVCDVRHSYLYSTTLTAQTPTRDLNRNCDVDTRTGNRFEYPFDELLWRVLSVWCKQIKQATGL